MQGRLKILVADDHQLMVQGVRIVLDTAGDMEVVGEARRGTQVLPLARSLEPDVVLLDIHLPEMDGLACLGLLRRHCPDVTVIMFSASLDKENVESALRSGARGCIDKAIDPPALAGAIRRIVDGPVGHVLGDPGYDTTTVARDAGLTEREVTILRYVARGLSNRAIGRELWLTEQTVKFHLTNVFRKLAVSNRTEAARAAYRLGVADNLIPERADEDAGVPGRRLTAARRAPGADERASSTVECWAVRGSARGAGAGLRVAVGAGPGGRAGHATA